MATKPSPAGDIDPVPPLVFSVSWALFVGYMTTGEAGTVANAPVCDGWDYLTGCNNVFSYWASIILLGTIPGASPLLNVPFAIAGLASRATIGWALTRLARGGG